VKRFICYLFIVSLVACTTTPQQFAEKRYSISNGNVCRTLRDAEKRGDYGFATEVRSEVDRRGLDDARCDAEITKQNVGAGLAIVAAALVVAAASKSGGGGGGNAYASSTDYDWAWDEFYNKSYQLVWMCRGKQTGQFADNSKCLYKPQNDFTWPSKSAP
jgi:hypothetical protein